MVKRKLVFIKFKNTIEKVKNLVLVPILFLWTHAYTIGVEVEQEVPNFETFNSEGKSWRLAKFRKHKNILLNFYPTVMTGVCTKQACACRDQNEKWQKLGVKIVGMIRDQPSNLSLLKKAENIDFTILLDFTGKIVEILEMPIGKEGIIERIFKSDKYSLQRGVTLKKEDFPDLKVR